MNTNAQCIIGTGTLTTNSSTADPIERYYNYERFQTIYTAAELTALGYTNGTAISRRACCNKSGKATAASGFTVEEKKLPNAT